MSTNSLEHLKQTKTSLKAERKPVSQVQDALIQAKEITESVSYTHLTLPTNREV